MRLLQIRGCDELSLVERLPDDLPPYAILSHTWGPSNEEVTYQDLLDGKGKEKVGYRKLILCGRQAAQEGFQYFWVDTCCIDKTSSAELSEAINSMYSWYQSAGVCYAYLADIGPEDSFSTSKWFTRGWTLQELLAPEEVIFFDKSWSLLGTRAGLGEEISECTRISVSVLSQAEPVETFSVAQRMSWAAERKTTRIEDIAYCLLGIFNINMPLIYGEGENAFIRLQEEILKISDDHSIFAWRSTDDRGGCLATSPASFRKSGNIVQCLALDSSYDPVILSGKGVHLNVRFMGIGHDKLGCAKLDCHEQGSGDERISIYLRDTSLTMRHLRRAKTEEFAQTDFGDFVSSRYPVRRLCIQKSRVESRRKGQLYGEPVRTISVTVASVQLPREEKMAESPKSLIEAVKIGTEDDVWLLLTRGDIEVNKEDYSNYTALTHAASNGKENIVKMLLNHTGIDISPQCVDGRTPLWWAVRNEHRAVVRLLLETGKAKVNLADKDGSTPLFVAVRSGNLAMAQLLLKVNGIEVNIKDRKRLTPLLWVTRMPLALAVQKTAQVDVNVRDANGRSPISRLANYTSDTGYEMAKLLLKIPSIEINSKDPERRTPLLWAVIRGNISMVQLLLRTPGVKVNARDNNGRTPLSWAASLDLYHIVKELLLIPHTDPNLEDYNANTPLSWALRTARPKTIEVLRSHTRHGYDIDL